MRARTEFSPVDLRCRFGTAALVITIRMVPEGGVVLDSRHAGPGQR